MKLLTKIALLSLISVGAAWAAVPTRTSVILINQTPFNIPVTWRGQDGGDSLGEGVVQGGPVTLASGQIYQGLVSFVRNMLIKVGSSYWFKQTIALPKPDGSGTLETVNLKQKITAKMALPSGSLAGGSLIDSDIWFGAIQEAKNSAIDWKSGFDPKNKSGRNSFTISGGTYEFIITYYYVPSVMEGADSYVIYVIDYRDLNAFQVDPVGDNGLNVLMLNLFMRSGQGLLFSDGQLTRAKYIPDMIGDKFDVVIFCEAFATKPRETLVSGMVAKGYKYYTNPLGYDQGGTVTKEGNVVLDNGGTMVMSRWPIEVQKEVLFGSTCTGSDCLARKGVWYVRINKNGKPYHIIASHTNAWEGAEQANVRGAQFIIMRDVIDRNKIPANEPVIIGGDFNVNMLKSDKTEFNRMMSTLKGYIPPRKGGHPYTVDARINKLVSQANVDKIPNATIDPSNPSAPNWVDIEWLDYLMIDSTHRKPNSSSYIRPILAKFPNDLVLEDSNFSGKPTMRDLSDHFPVYGHFVFDGY